MQWTSKKCTKKRDARAELLFSSLNLLFFMFPLPSSSWIRKVPKLYPPAHPYGLLYDVEETFFDEVSVSILPVAIQGEVKNGLKNHGS